MVASTGFTIFREGIDGPGVPIGVTPLPSHRAMF